MSDRGVASPSAGAPSAMLDGVSDSEELAPPSSDRPVVQAGTSEAPSSRSISFPPAAPSEPETKSTTPSSPVAPSSKREPARVLVPVSLPRDVKRAPRHWPLLVLTTLLLLGAVTLVTAAALPAVARELGWTHARTVSRATKRATNASRAGIDAVREREQRLALDGIDEEDDGPPLGLDRATGTQIGVSAQDTALFRGPASSTALVGSVESGEKLLVVREERGFFLVIHKSKAGTDIGWVRKADVLIR